MSQWSLHPATPILAWLMLALLLAKLSPEAVLLATASLVFLSIVMRSRQAIRLLLRARWIMVAIMAVYAYATPGRALWPALGMLSPTFEGVFDGGVQVLRLAGPLIALSLLLAHMPQARMIAGLYALARPASLLGVSRERLVIRLALTLQYAEINLQQPGRTWGQVFQGMSATDAEGGGRVSLDSPAFGWRDGALLVFFLMLCGWGGR